MSVSDGFLFFFTCWFHPLHKTGVLTVIVATASYWCQVFAGFFCRFCEVLGVITEIGEVLGKC